MGLILVEELRSHVLGSAAEKKKKKNKTIKKALLIPLTSLLLLPKPSSSLKRLTKEGDNFFKNYMKNNLINTLKTIHSVRWTKTFHEI